MELTDAQIELLNSLEEAMANRYTEDDPDYRRVMEKQRLGPPIMENWGDNRRGGQDRNRRFDNRRDYRGDGRQRDDRRYDNRDRERDRSRDRERDRSRDNREDNRSNRYEQYRGYNAYEEQSSRGYRTQR